MSNTILSAWAVPMFTIVQSHVAEATPELNFADGCVVTSKQGGALVKAFQDGGYDVVFDELHDSAFIVYSKLNNDAGLRIEKEDGEIVVSWFDEAFA